MRIDAALLTRVSQDVAIACYGLGTFTAKWMMIATWYNVSYFVYVNTITPIPRPVSAKISRALFTVPFQHIR